jgi:hypothetical protein
MIRSSPAFPFSIMDALPAVTGFSPAAVQAAAANAASADADGARSYRGLPDTPIYTHVSARGHEIHEIRNPAAFIALTGMARDELREHGSPIHLLVRDRPVSYYTDSRARMFVTPDGMAGIAVKQSGPDAGEVVSAWTTPADPAGMPARLGNLAVLMDFAAEMGGTHLSCYDISPRQRDFYEVHDWHLVAVMDTSGVTDDEAAAPLYPAGWMQWEGREKFDGGRPAGLYYVHDPEGVLDGRQPIAVPNYEAGCVAQAGAIIDLDEYRHGSGRA